MKKIGNCTYVHRSNIEELSQLTLYKINEILNQDFMREFDWAVLKVDHKNNAISFIESKDWDIAREPSVGDSIRVNCTTGEIKRIKARGQIYHHKWMFVAENYQGFNVAEAKAWSKKWTSIMPKGHHTKYGQREYWNNLLGLLGLEEE